MLKVNKYNYTFAAFQSVTEDIDHATTLGCSSFDCFTQEVLGVHTQVTAGRFLE